MVPPPEPSPGRRLLILRHGKAADQAPGGGDLMRPLTARGRRDATALGRALAAGSVAARPEVVVCSAAVRTRQTAELVVEGAGGGVPVDSLRTLYGADPELVLRYVREIDEEVGCALVVGHNPTAFELAVGLVGAGGPAQAETDRRALEAHGFPTCALADLRVEAASWEDVAFGCAELVGVHRPPY